MENKLYEVKWKELINGEVIDFKKVNLTQSEVQSLMMELMVKGVIDLRITELPKRVRLKDYRDFEIDKPYKMGDFLVKYDGDNLFVSKVYDNWIIIFEYDDFYKENAGKELYLIVE